MSLIEYALRVAKEYYDPDTYDHAMRVAGYVADNERIPEEYRDTCISLAIMHDLLEDTDYIVEDFYLPERVISCLTLLSKPKGQTYIGYVTEISFNYSSYPEAYWVKLADMKDHLMQTDTLTDKLKEKYLAAIPYLL